MRGVASSVGVEVGSGSVGQAVRVARQARWWQRDNAGKPPESEAWSEMRRSTWITSSHNTRGMIPQRENDRFSDSPVKFGGPLKHCNTENTAPGRTFKHQTYVTRGNKANKAQDTSGTSANRNICEIATPSNPPNHLRRLKHGTAGRLDGLETGEPGEPIPPMLYLRCEGPEYPHSGIQYKYLYCPTADAWQRKTPRTQRITSPLEIVDILRCYLT
ncbi:hypothetical protein C8R43DRAFT_946853 [Mycena crocata]|nr:hypothetical protein C8R43DRAFT_946853 [Mycena crocata]